MSNVLKKAKDRLEARIKSYEEICSRRSDDGKGFRRPGALKTRK